MAELSLYTLTQKIDNVTASLQAQINGKEDRIIETPFKRWFSDTERLKLQGIQNGAEVNQNAISNIKVGYSTILSNSKTSTLELFPGDNIGIEADLANTKVTIKVIGKVPLAVYADTAGSASANGGNADTVDGKHATDFAPAGHTHDNVTLLSFDYSKLLNKPTFPTSLPANGGNADMVDGYHASDFARATHVHDNSTINSVDWSKITNVPINKPNYYYNNFINDPTYMSVFECYDVPVTYEFDKYLLWYGERKGYIALTTGDGLNTSEINAWQRYKELTLTDFATNISSGIKNPNNTVNPNMLVGTLSFSKYTHEMTMFNVSGDGDNDYVYYILAYDYDKVTGQDHYLCLCMQGGNESSSEYKQQADGYADSVLGQDVAWSIVYNPFGRNHTVLVRGTWTKLPSTWSAISPCTLKVIRNNSVFTCTLTDKGGVINRNPITFDLNNLMNTSANSFVSRFNKPCRTGIGVFSQPFVFQTTNFTSNLDSEDTMYNVCNNKVYKRIRSNAQKAWGAKVYQWQETGQTVSSLYKPGDILISSIDNRKYYVLNETTIIEL